MIRPKKVDIKSVSKKGSTIFYGWFVVAACFAAMTVLAEAFSSFGVFFKSLENEFSWSRTLVSSGFTAFAIGYCISAVVAGRLADRYSPRLTLLASSFLGGLGIILCTWMNTVGQFRLFAFITGMGTGATFSIPTSIVQRWFRDRRTAGTALALVISGFGAGQLIFTPLINYFILSYGWRNAYLLAGSLFFATVFISSLVIRQSPTEAAGLRGKETAESTGAGGWGTAKAVASLAYAAILYAACTSAIAFQIVTVHLVPHATDLGISSTTAAAALGLVGGLSVPSRLTSSFVSRRIGWQRLWYWSLLATAASLIWLLFLNTTWMLYGFVFLYGTFVGVWAVAQWGVLAEFFGLRSIGELAGVTSGISNLVGAVAPYLAGFIFDTTGSYFTAFALTAAAVFSGGLVVALIKKPPPTPK